MRLLHLIPKHTKIDFVGLRWVGFSITGLTLLVTVVSLWMQGLNLGIDFTGGVVIEAHQTSGGTVDQGSLRTQLEQLNLGEVILQSIGGADEGNVLIRVQPSAEMIGQEQKVVEQLKGKLGSEFEFRKTDAVGPKVSGELFLDGVYASILSVVMIAIYVWFRFEWQFGVSAFIATFHDVFIVVGLFSVTRLTFDLASVAAILTLAGYSINDTVVIFDRIRENRRKFKKMGLAELINLSTNQTLARTVMTSITTALSVIPLVFFGGDLLFGFSIAILFGIVTGTYSSIYVASALLLYMKPIGAMERAVPPKGGPMARP